MKFEILHDIFCAHMQMVRLQSLEFSTPALVYIPIISLDQPCQSGPSSHAAQNNQSISQFLMEALSKRIPKPIVVMYGQLSVLPM